MRAEGHGAVTTDPGVTRKLDNLFKWIWNPIPWKPDNPEGDLESSTKRNPDPVSDRVNHANLDRHKLV